MAPPTSSTAPYSASRPPSSAPHHQHPHYAHYPSTYPPPMLAHGLPYYAADAPQLSPSYLAGDLHAAHLQGFLPADTGQPPSAAYHSLPPGPDYSSLNPPSFAPISSASSLSAASESRQKRTRIRPVVSCMQCRQRRSKCNRVYPCYECERRGEAVACDFSGSAVAPTPATPMRNDPELQAYAARLEVKNGELQRRLDALMASGDVTATSSSSSSSTRQQQHQSTGAAGALGPGSGSGSVSGPQKIISGDQSRRSSWVSGSPLLGVHRTPAPSPAQLREAVDIGANNLAGQLAEVVVGRRSRAGDRAHPLLAQLVAGVDERRDGESSLDPLALEAVGSRRPSATELAHQLPTEAQARACVAAFRIWINCWHDILDVASFEAEIGAFWTLLRSEPAPGRTGPDISRVDRRWLAVYFGVCSLGAEVMDDALAGEVGLMGPARESIARDWRTASFRSVATSGVFSAPDLNTVRALCLLLYRRPPENLDSTFWVLCSAISVAGQLGLWHEPSSLMLEADRDARRSLAWFLSDVDWINGPLYGKTWHFLDAEACTIALPGDPPHTDVRIPPMLNQSPTNPMLECFRVRCVLGRISFRMNRDIFSARVIDYVDVLNTEQDLRALENHLPTDLGQVLAGMTIRPWPSLPSEVTISGLGTVLRLCNLRLRLHEAFVSPAVPSRKLPPAVDVRHHQDQLLRYARVILNMWRSAVFVRAWTQPLVVYVNTATALSILFATVGPSGLPEHTDVRAALAELVDFLRREENGIAARAVAILDRLAELRLEPAPAGPAKTVDMNQSQSDVSISQDAPPSTSGPASKFASPWSSPRAGGYLFAPPGGHRSVSAMARAVRPADRASSVPTSRRTSLGDGSPSSSSSSASPTHATMTHYHSMTGLSQHHHPANGPAYSPFVSPMMRASGMPEPSPTSSWAIRPLPPTDAPASATSPTFGFHHAGSSPPNGPGAGARAGAAFFSVGPELFGDWGGPSAGAGEGNGLEGLEEQTPKGHPGGGFLPHDD